jgi:alpha-beta hydrolase superfamily lysophospholipase
MKTQDGVELFVRDWPLPAGARRRGSALIIQGLGEQSGRYAHVGAALNEIGVAVRAYDQRGFGQSGPARRHSFAERAARRRQARVRRFAAEAKAAGDPRRRS